MVKRITVLLSLLVCAPLLADAALTRNLRLGDSGEDVRELQTLLNTDPDTRVADSGAGAPGNETTYFGRRTEEAVRRFQEKHSATVLAPVGLTAPSGFVGTMTRTQLLALRTQTTVAVPVVPSRGIATTTPVVVTPASPTTTGPSKAVSTTSTPAVSVPTTTSKVAVTSVSPERVREGETVRLVGRGFTLAGNTVTLAYGTVARTFSNLSSPDGTTLSFTYRSPEPDMMTIEEIRALPTDVRAQIENPILSAGGTLEQVVSSPYKQFLNEDELATNLSAQGHSIAQLDELFHVYVSNQNGTATAPTLLRAVPRREFSGGSLGQVFSSLFSPLAHAFSLKPDTAYAQVAGGGFHVTMIFPCTCGGGTLNFLLTMGGGGGGLTYFPPGYVPVAGSTAPGAFWLGFTTPGGGTCSIVVGYTCIQITASLPSTPYGQSN